MPEKRKMAFFERYLSIWVALCIAAGLLMGFLLPSEMAYISSMQWEEVNLPIAVLIWLMIYPMMLQVDFQSLKHVSRKPKGLLLTLMVNWLVKPFSMAFFAWFFFTQVFGALIDPERAGEYIAGAILLGAAPCTAMVFVWSYLSRGDANYTLLQVAVNDLVILLAFVPIVGLLLGITEVQIPYETLVLSMVLYLVFPLLAGAITSSLLIRAKGKAWFESHFLPKLKPLSIFALLLTLVLLFAFQGEQLLHQPFIIALIAVPLIVQTYSVFFLAWFAGQKLKLSHAVCAPSALIGASNFFELAVAVAISLFGLDSPAALVCVVGVLVEVPVMLSLVAFANRRSPQK